MVIYLFCVEWGIQYRGTGSRFSVLVLIVLLAFADGAARRHLSLFSAKTETQLVKGSVMSGDVVNYARS